MLFSIKECGSIILFKYFFIICIDFKNFYFYIYFLKSKKIKKIKIIIQRTTRTS